MLPKLRCSSEGGWLLLSDPGLMYLPVPPRVPPIHFPLRSLLVIEKVALFSFLYQLCQFIRLVLGVRQRLGVPGICPRLIGLCLPALVGWGILELVPFYFHVVLAVWTAIPSEVLLHPVLL